jgi:hypothetical protein
VAKYLVYRGSTSGFTADASSQIAQATTLSYSDSSRPVGTWYYRVVAVDAAGNASAASASASAVVQGAPVQRYTVTLPAVADTMVAENNSAFNYGTNNQLSSRAPGSGTELQAYLRYDLSGIPTDATLVSASLQLTTSNDPTAGTTGTHRVKLLTGTWSEGSTVWTNRPTGLGATLGELTSAPDQNTAYTTTLDVAGLQRDSSDNVSLALVGASSDNLRINSREAGTTAARPSLTITYEK